MTKSMTGYGNATFENDQIGIQVEIKTLNSKFLDINSKVPKEISAMETDLRKIISDRLIRGKVNFSVEFTVKSGTDQALRINPELFQHYKNQFEQVTGNMQLADADILNSILKTGDVFEHPASKRDLVDRATMVSLINEALDKCDAFRAQEGASVDTALRSFAHNITQSLEAIKVKDPERIQHVKNRINESLKELNAADMSDPNRFEQELIYYIEKLDIAEEVVRLENHMRFFNTTLAETESQGKKLGFISQEMGREINTIGSKANNADIQKLVVEMKDELEKIKEQVLNII
ncbi:YicC/YloC family endoribonuclease [Reichenbachiella agariperforans]|uniref:YicC/YloC family endoribonuclease n=1 Tax=Reichenbachiella agariperforans TaxID=156994 RepID=UPI001C09507C|nr:YicC/YloC family endoribonuclease [Reichenbachiella agariperforans]MBU2915536.1 YicC family protein [Reichenbachiella agariperforans]